MALVEAKFYETKIVPIIFAALATSATVFPNIGSKPKQIEISFLFDCSVPAAARLVFVRYNGRIVGAAYTNGAAMGMSQKYVSSDPNLFTSMMLVEFVDENGAALALTGRGSMFITYFN